MHFERQQITEELYKLNAININLKSNYEVLFNKNSQKSIEVRKKGNQLFAKKKHNEELHGEILKLYTESIAFALTESEELACGYANRSALLLHLKNYKDCLLDIERALKITQSSALKVKLYCRQTEVFAALQDGKRSNSLEKAKYWLNKVLDNSESKKLQEMIDKVEKVTNNFAAYDVKKEKQKDIFCDNDAVNIEYDEKYGRHLVAARDILPGEFVYLEKYYATSISKSKSHVYCSHCLGISWALIPCDQCAHFMYCSEECKKKAWIEYHDIECRVKFNGPEVSTIYQHYCQLALRSLIMGIKEFGSLSKLQDLVDELEKCTDMKTKGFSKNGKFCSNSFRSLFSLSYAQCHCHINMFTLLSTGLMINFAKYTTIFGENFDFGDGRQLIQNQDVIFVGSVLLRLSLIFKINAFGVINPNSQKCKFLKDRSECLKDACCMRGANICLFTSLLNHSCDNNVDKVYTNDGKVAYYALKPIQKNSQIFSSYDYNDFLYVSIERRHLLKFFFEFECDCRACQQNWPDYENIMEEEKSHINRGKHTKLSVKLMEKSRNLMCSIANDEKDSISTKAIGAFVKTYMEVQNSMKTSIPMIVFSTFRITLSTMMEKRYGSTSKLPDTC